MSPKSWTESLNQTVTRLRASNERPLRLGVVGIGHELRGDDAAGLVVAQQLRPFAHQHLLVIEAGHAPENHTGLLRRFNPDLIILVDSAQLNQPPGTVRWLPWQETTGLSATTHTMPPYMLARYLTAELGCEVALIGIQPENNAIGVGFSTAVQEATGAVVHSLKSNLIDPQ